MCQMCLTNVLKIFTTMCLISKLQTTSNYVILNDINDHGDLNGSLIQENIITIDPTLISTSSKNHLSSLSLSNNKDENKTTTYKILTTLSIDTTILDDSTIITKMPIGYKIISESVNQSQQDIKKINNGDLMRPTIGTTKQLTKIHKTDAPLLNYIFDSHSLFNRHHHHNHRYGPHFEDLSFVGNVTNITVQAGTTILLNCRISLLQDKTVSWVRRKHKEANLQLLTVGLHTYSGDSRYTIEFQYPNNWRLKIAYIQKTDEAMYECQISTHPPRVIQINLYVYAPEVIIVDEHGLSLNDKYYQVGSTIQLSCIIKYISMSSSVVFWNHGDTVLNYDTSRGGISLKTDLMEIGANSTLSIAKVNKSDSGNYSCSISSTQQYTVTVHVLNGESLAELYSASNKNYNKFTTNIILLCLSLITHLTMQIFCIINTEVR